MALSNEQKSHIQQLIEKLEDQDTSPQEQVELTELLRSSPEVRQMYWDHMTFSTLLQHEAINLDIENKLLPLPGTDRKKQNRAMLRAFSLAAAAIVLLAIVAHFILLPEKEAYASYSLSQGAQCTVTHASDDLPESSITSGTNVELKSGQITVAIPDGTTLYIEAPASLKFNTLHEIVLKSGELWADAGADSEEQLTIQSKDYTIKDIGTQFGVIKQPNRALEVHLIEGEIEISHDSSTIANLTKPSAISLLSPSKTQEIPLDIGPFSNPFDIIQVDFSPQSNIYGVPSDQGHWNNLMTVRHWRRGTWGAVPKEMEQLPLIPIKNSRGEETEIGVILVRSEDATTHQVYAINDPTRAFRDPLLDDYICMRSNEKGKTNISASVIFTGLDEDSTYDLATFAASKTYVHEGIKDYQDTELRVHHRDGKINGFSIPDSSDPIMFKDLKPFKHEKYGTVIILDWGWLTKPTKKAQNWALLNGLILTER